MPDWLNAMPECGLEKMRMNPSVFEIKKYSVQKSVRRPANGLTRMRLILFGWRVLYIVRGVRHNMDDYALINCCWVSQPPGGHWYARKRPDDSTSSTPTKIILCKLVLFDMMFFDWTHSVSFIVVLRPVRSLCISSDC